MHSGHGIETKMFTVILSVIRSTLLGNQNCV
jgi:hypothetical protein